MRIVTIVLASLLLTPIARAADEPALSIARQGSLFAGGRIDRLQYIGASVSPFVALPPANNPGAG
jgi:hypothetical protein